jgi:hypothetical protein
MSIPEQVVGFLGKNKGNWYCKTCISNAIGTPSEPLVNTVMVTLSLCVGYSAKYENCPACLSDRNRYLVKANLIKTARATTLRRSSSKRPEPNLLLPRTPFWPHLRFADLSVL